MYTSKSNNFLVTISVILFVIVAISSIINIGFKVSNSKLEDAIEILSDEKANLRAKYLSEIALGKLDSKADEMEMKYASNQECLTISSEQKINQQKTCKKTRDKILVTGY